MFSIRLRFGRAPLRLAIVLSLATGAQAQGNPSAPSLVLQAPQRPIPLMRSRALPDARGVQDLTVIEPPDEARLRAEDEQAGPGPQRIGVVRAFEPVTTDMGEWRQLADGDWLWTWVFRCAGARGMRLRVRDWDAELGGELTFHASQGIESRGPLFRADVPASGELWSPTVHGDHVVVECRLAPGVGLATSTAALSIDGVLFVYRGIEPESSPAGGGGGGNPLTCHLDWACEPDWSTVGQGVVALNWINDGAGFFCSGAILDRTPQDFAPLVMTATHCDVTQQNAGTLEVVWFWQRSSCGGSIPDPAGLPATVGSTVLVSDVTTDWTLIGLRDEVPGGATFLGWDQESIPVGSRVAGIHHPRGSWKRASFGEKNSEPGPRPDPGGGQQCVLSTTHDKVYWYPGRGLVEPASSGSPLLDASSQLVVGVLSCAVWDCAGGSWGSYGRLDEAYPLLEPYLDPVDPVYTDADHDGPERGTAAQPFDSVREASFAVIAGSVVRLAAGVYEESLRIDRPMRLEAVGGVVVIR